MAAPLGFGYSWASGDVKAFLFNETDHPITYTLSIGYIVALATRIGGPRDIANASFYILYESQRHSITTFPVACAFKALSGNDPPYIASTECVISKDPFILPPDQTDDLEIQFGVNGNAISSGSNTPEPSSLLLLGSGLLGVGGFLRKRLFSRS